jgi:hypothetical protein
MFVLEMTRSAGIPSLEDTHFYKVASNQDRMCVFDIFGLNLGRCQPPDLRLARRNLRMITGVRQYSSIMSSTVPHELLEVPGIYKVRTSCRISGVALPRFPQTHQDRE